MRKGYKPTQILTEPIQNESLGYSLDIVPIKLKERTVDRIILPDHK